MERRRGNKQINKQKIVPGRDFHGNSVFQSSPSNVGGQGILGQGTKILHTSLPESQRRKQKQYCGKFNKDFYNGPH